MSDTLRESIITSDCAERFLQRVSPIYDNSFVGLWMFEAIGREYDDLWELVRTLADQITPDTATWAIELWEQRYGIEPDPSIPLEERRTVVQRASEKPSPFTPARLEKALSNITGRKAMVLDYISPYTFAIYLIATDTQKNTSTIDLKKYVDSKKPSHLSYGITFQADEGVSVSVETQWWRLTYPYAGSGIRAGEYPDTNTVGRTINPGIAAEADAGGYSIPYPICGCCDCSNTGL